MEKIDKRRHTGLFLFLLAGLSLFPALSSADSIRTDAPDVYYVKKGDTLWDISARFLRNPWEWKRIWVNNPHIKNPHWIYPKDKLMLCDIKGQKRIGRDEGDGCAGIARQYEGTSIKLTPGIRLESIEDPIASIALGDIAMWLKHSIVADANVLRSAPYVVAIGRGNVIGGAGSKVYVRGSGIQVGSQYAFYHPGEEFVQPRTQKKLGWEARLVARGIAVAQEKDITTIDVKESLDTEIRAGDRLLVEPENDLPAIFNPANNPQLPEGVLLRVPDSIGNATVHSVIALSIGRAQGAKPNDLVAIYRKGSNIRDEKRGDIVSLPNERAGLAMIFRTFDQVSYAYVLESEDVLRVGDVIKPAVSSD